MDRNTKPRLGAATLVAALLLGCQPSQPDNAMDEPAPSTPAPPQASPQTPPTGMDERMPDLSAETPARDTTPVDTTIDAVRLSAEGDTEENTLGAPTSIFGPRDSVYAEIQSNGTASEYTIYAKWIGADGNVLADYGIRVNEAGPKRTVISLSKPDGWPEGENRIELAINGKVLRTETFTVH